MGHPGWAKKKVSTQKLSTPTIGAPIVSEPKAQNKTKTIKREQELLPLLEAFIAFVDACKEPPLNLSHPNNKRKQTFGLLLNELDRYVDQRIEESTK